MQEDITTNTSVHDVVIKTKIIEYFLYQVTLNIMKLTNEKIQKHEWIVIEFLQMVPVFVRCYILDAKT